MKDIIGQGETLFADGKINEAENLFAEALREDPENIEILNNLGVISHSLGKNREAEGYLLEALTYKKDYLEAIGNLADLYIAEKRLKDAALYLKMYIVQDEQNTHAFNQLATIYLEIGNIEDAKQALERSITLNPNQTMVLESLNQLISIPPKQNEAHNKPCQCSTSERNHKIVFLEAPGTSNVCFIDPIVEHFSHYYQTRYAKTTNREEINELVNWADIVWLEWANQMAIHVTNNIPEIKNKKVICRLHGYEVFTDLPSKINWKVVDNLIFVAKHKQQIFNDRFKVESPPQTIIRNGINIDKFSIPADKRNTKRLVLLGYLNLRKGLPILLHFYHELLKHDPDFYLFIRGEFQDLRLEMATRTMIKELSLNHKLEFVDWVDDLNSWLQDKSHILSFSIEESFHYAIGDGMAAGLKPCIHAWTESKEIWPKEFIFSDLDGFLRLMTEDSYEPERYRRMLYQYKLTSKDQINQIGTLLEDLSINTTNSSYLVPPDGKLEVKSKNENSDTQLLPFSYSSTKEKRNIFIIGLKRSGTTIFWECIRKDKRFKCFDEPFHPNLFSKMIAGADNNKDTLREFLQSPGIVLNHWSSIQPYEELISNFIPHQVAYLKALLGSASNVCIDFVRCHTKIKELRKVDPNALIIHLVRDPRAFATSHLKPYGKWTSKDLPEQFFEYAGWFDFWQYESLCNILEFNGPAFYKLLQLWKKFTELVEHQEPDITLRFEDFAMEPKNTIKRLYDMINLEFVETDLTNVHPPNPPFNPVDERWKSALDKIGINSTFIFDYSN